jgi:hypothetical protein
MSQRAHRNASKLAEKLPRKAERIGALHTYRHANKDCFGAWSLGFGDFRKGRNQQPTRFIKKANFIDFKSHSKHGVIRNI